MSIAHCDRYSLFKLEWKRNREASYLASSSNARQVTYEARERRDLRSRSLLFGAASDSGNFSYVVHVSRSALTHSTSGSRTHLQIGVLSLRGNVLEMLSQCRIGRIDFRLWYLQPPRVSAESTERARRTKMKSVLKVDK